MRSFVFVFLAVSLVLSAAAPAAAQSGGGTDFWLSLLQRFRGYLQQVQNVLNTVWGVFGNLAPVYNITGRLPSLFGLDYLGDVASSLESQISALPQHLTWRLSTLLAGIRSPQQVPEDSAAAILQKAARINPAVTLQTRQRVEAQAAGESAVTQAAATAEKSTELAKRLTEDTSLEEAVSRASADAQFLRQASEAAQSTRALIQLLNEGVASYMVQNAAFAQVLTTHLQALAQQNAMTNQELSTAIAILAQILVRQEARKEQDQTAQVNSLKQLLEMYGRALGTLAGPEPGTQPGTQR